MVGSNVSPPRKKLRKLPAIQIKIGTLLPYLIAPPVAAALSDDAMRVNFKNFIPAQDDLTQTLFWITPLLPKVVMATTPPPIQAPTAKEKKYDRQLRLWAAAGQRALEEAHVLLVVGGQQGSNSSVAGGEALKNLVLPGVGQFTVADSATVTEADLGVNFFLEPDSLGRSRAEETKKLLQELNPDVTGHAKKSDLAEWLSNTDATLKPYSLILLCAPTPSKIRKTISEYAQDNSIPLIYIHCAGFYSYFSIQLPSTFPIADTHPDPDSTQDLRLLEPWQELSEEVGKLGDLKGMDDYEHGHIPYLYLLLHYLEKWKTTHSGNLPSTFKEKTQFRDLVREGARTNNSDGGEENFDEACAAVLKAINSPFVGSGLKEMFTMPACIGLTANSPNFWIIANAIKVFYKQHSVLPLPGSLPDMKARSADYITLQNVYKSKARADVSEVLQTVRATEKSLGRQIAVSESEVEQFCKNAAHVKVLAGQSLIHTRLAQPEVLKALEASLTDPSALEPHLTPIFMSLVQMDDIDESTKAALNTLTNGNTLKEAQRAKNAELHNIASLTGGQVAQEAIKIITRQYVPVDNLGIFDGINNSRSEVLKF